MHCSIIPNYMFKELVEKTHGPDRDRFQRALMSLNTFIEGIKPFEVPDLFAKSGRVCLTHDCENKFHYPGKLILKDKDVKHKIVDAENAHKGAKFTYDFFKEVFGRSSLDDKDIQLNSHVRYGQDFANAMYDGKNNMIYGEGDGEIFKTFVITDVIGHEFSHGVVQNTANLEYYSQSGALNEHYADVFGSMIKQYSLKQTAKEADWLIGEGIFGPSVNGKSLRDMLNPGEAYDDEVIGKDSQPNHMDGYDPDMKSDNAGVHRWSGIPNRIFANVALRFEEESYKRAGKIWWNTLTKRLKHNSSFQEAVDGWVAESGELFGKNSKEQKTVIDCCKLVGLKPSK